MPDAKTINAAASFFQMEIQKNGRIGNLKHLNEQQIAALAPNPTAAVNGKKISQKGGFVRRECSADGSFYLGECTGSGKSNYIVTADFINPDQPVFRCSCPSRQFPCKHSLALLYEILAEKPFTTCEVSPDILEKRKKIQARAEKKQTDSAAGEKKPAKVNKSAWTKKLKKQLEGLELAAKLIQDLLRAGLGTMGGTALDTYRQLSKQLGDYYLPGPQRLLNGLILEIEEFQKDGEDAHYDKAIRILEELWALVKKSREYLSGKLERGEIGLDESPLYEDLGGVWKLSELEGLGLCKKDARFTQLAFWIEFHKARKEFIDIGCWADLEDGNIFLTRNYRPVKALKNIKQEDSTFGVAEIPSAALYPGNGNRRLRWESARIGPLKQEDCSALYSYGAPALAPVVKEAKNILKDPLADPVFYKLIRFAQISHSPEGLALTDSQGSSILLADRPGTEPSTKHLLVFPEADALKDNVLLGAFWYDGVNRRLAIQPLSIITPDSVIRLLY